MNISRQLLITSILLGWSTVSLAGTFSSTPIDGWGTDYPQEEAAQPYSQYRFDPIQNQYSHYWVNSSVNSSAPVATIMPWFEHSILFQPTSSGDNPPAWTTVTLTAEYKSSVSNGGTITLLNLNRTPLITQPVSNYQVVGTIAVLIPGGNDPWNSLWSRDASGNFSALIKVQGLGIQANCLSGGTAAGELRYSVTDIH